MQGNQGAFNGDVNSDDQAGQMVKELICNESLLLTLS